MVAHASYFCSSPAYFRGNITRPFPTRREMGVTRNFVGSNGMVKFDITVNKTSWKCPVMCRPEQHQDWEYC